MKAISRNRMTIVVVVALSALPIPGCTLFPQEKVEIKKEVLNKIPLLPEHRGSAATLLVYPLESEPLYDTTQIAYTAVPFQIAYFSNHEWAETPVQMLQSLLIRTLENSHYFNAVVTPPYSARYTAAIRTQLLELTQNFTTEPAELRLSLHCQVIDGTTGRVRATKEIAIHQPMREKNPEAGVAAANDAAAMAMQEIAEFVLAQVH